MPTPTLKALSLALATAWSCGAHAEVVQANSNYFAGWQIASFVNSSATFTKGTPVAATVGGATFSLNWLEDVGVGSHYWGQWYMQRADLMTYGETPARIGLPTRPGDVWEMGGARMSIKFTAPVLWGTTLFSHDFDVSDAAEYRFYRCDGTQIDAASVVEFIQVSTTDMPVQTPPVPGAADSHWLLESPVPFALDAGIVSGLMVKTNDVCEIQVTELGRTGHSTVDFMLGVAPAEPQPMDDTRSTSKDTPVTIDVRGNDTVTQPSATLAVPTITTPPANGTATVDGAGNVVYTPNPEFVGTDTFTYEVCTAVSGPARRCKQAQVTVTVGAAVPANSPVGLLPLAGLIGWAARRTRRRA